MKDDIPYAVVVNHLTHVYGGRKAIDDISLMVESGETFALLGPNGSGKTTLLRILSTLIRPTTGEQILLGLRIVREIRRSIGVVFQSCSLDLELTLFENLRHQGHLYGLWGRALHQRIGEMLARLGLIHRAGDRVETLSGGMRRRLDIAKALLHQPKLLLLDEPTAGLDPLGRRELWSDLRSLGMTVLFATHLLEEAEEASRVAILDDGHLIACDTPSRLRDQVGGDVIIIRTPHPDVLSREIAGQFGGDPFVVNGTVRVERVNGPEFVPRLAEAFPGRIDSLSVARPTLEDAFIRMTKRSFFE